MRASDRSPSADGGEATRKRLRVATPRALARLLACVASLAMTISTAEALTALVAVASQDDASVALIDPARLAVVGRIAVGRGPAGVARAPDGASFFVSHPDGAAVDVVSTATERVRPLVVKGEPFGLAAGPAALYVADWAHDVVTRIDPASGAVTGTLAIGKSPANATLDAARGRLYVADRESDDVSIVDTVAMKVVARVPTGAAPFALALSPDGGRLYVANVRSGDLGVIDTATMRKIASVPVGAMPYGVAVTPDGATILVTNQHANCLTLVDARTLRPAGTIGVGRYPEGVLATADGRAYVANWFSGDVSVVDIDRRREITRIKVGEGPRYLVAIPAPAAP